MSACKNAESGARLDIHRHSSFVTHRRRRTSAALGRRSPTFAEEQVDCVNVPLKFHVKHRLSLAVVSDSLRCLAQEFRHRRRSMPSSATFKQLWAGREPKFRNQFRTWECPPLAWRCIRMDCRQDNGLRRGFQLNDRCIASPQLEAGGQAGRPPDRQSQGRPIGGAL